MATAEAAERALQTFHKWTLCDGRYQLCVDIARSTKYTNTNAPKVINESIALRPETDQVMKQSMSSSVMKQSISSSAASSYKKRSCTVCQKQASKQCPRCKIPYCSRECQRQDWPKHKIICLATRTMAKEVPNVTPNSRPSVSSSDSEFEKRFEVSTGKEFESVVAEVITNDKHMAEDVSKIIVQNEDAEEGQLLNHQQVKNRTHEPSPLKCVELHDNSEVILMSYISPSDFWVVLAMSSPVLAQLQEKLNKFYMNTSPDDSFLPAQGDLCAGQFSMDKNWYRCRIDCLLANSGEVAVSYVDYGNAEVIPVSSIRLLHSHFADLPLQAIHCSLYGIKPTGGKWSVNAIQHASALMPESKIFSVIVKEREETCTFVDVISADGHNVAELLVTEGHAQNITRKMQKNINVQPDNFEHKVSSAEKPFSQGEENSVQGTGSEREKLPQPVNSLQSELSSFTQSKATPVITKVQDGLKLDDVITIKIKVIKSPSEFWAHVVSDHNMKGLTFLTSELNAYYSQLETNRDFVPSPTDLFACYCLADKQCKRAQLRRASEKCLDVFYVDYGTMDVVSSSVVHPLLPSHYELPMQALSCSLDGIHGTNSDGSWNQEATDLFIKHTSENVAVKIMSKDEKCCRVSVMLPDGSTLNDLLIKKQLAFPLHGRTQIIQQEPATGVHSGVKGLPALSDPENDIVVTVAYAPNVNNIVVQLMREEDISQLMSLQQVMDNFRPSVSSFQPKEGDLIAAKYSLDGKWYRAEVKKVISASKFHVYFIDYGNEEEVTKTSVAPLPENAYKYRPLGIRCSLAGIKEGPEWNPDLLENQIFKMTIADPAVSEKHVVQLFNKETGCSVNDQLVEIGFALRDVEERSMCISDNGSGRSTKCIMSAEVPYQSVDSDQIPAVTVYYLNSAEFYIVCCIPEVLLAAQNMTIALQDAYSNSTNMADAGAEYEPVNGELVAAYCVSDQCWYRAEVLKTSMKDIEVLYTEYGNKESVSTSQVRQLLPQFAKLPKQALKCRLEGELTFSNETVLPDAIQDKILIYKLHDSGASNGNLTVVDIMLPDGLKSLISQIGHCDTGIIKKHGTPSSPASNLENGTTFLQVEEATNGQRPFGVEKDTGAHISPLCEENLDPKKLLEENIRLKKIIRDLHQQLSEMQMKMKQNSSG